MTATTSVAVVLALTGTAVARILHRRWLTPLSVFSYAWLLVLGVHVLQVLPYDPLTQVAQRGVILLVTGAILGSIAANRVRIPRLDPHSVARFPELVSRYVSILRLFVVAGAAGLALLVYLNPARDGAGSESGGLDKAGSLYPPVYAFLHSLAFPTLMTAAVIGISLYTTLLGFQPHHAVADHSTLRHLTRNCLTCCLAAAALFVVHDLVTLGRMSVVTLMLIAVSAFGVVRPVHIRNLWHLLIGTLAVFSTLAFIALITQRRSAASTASAADIVLSWLHYLCGPLAYFGTALDADLVQPGHGGRTVLMAVEAFFIRPIDWLPLGKILPPYPEYYAERQTPLFVGDGLYYNAFGTVMLDAYYDFGLAGVLGLGLAMGFAATYLYRRARQSPGPIVTTLAVTTCTWMTLSPIMWGGGWQTKLGQVPFWLLITHFVACKGLPRNRRLHASRVPQYIDRSHEFTPSQTHFG